MNSSAQAGLEYLMTYGWMLVLIATVIGVLVFVVSPPANSVIFSSSDQTKIMLKGGSVDDQGNVAVIAQNITGGAITITSFYAGKDFMGAGNTGGILNGVNAENISSANPVKVTGGGTLDFTSLQYVGLGTVDGTINITYNEYAGIEKKATIKAQGKTKSTATEITRCGTQALGGNYVLTADNLRGSNCITFTTDQPNQNFKLNCQGKTIDGQVNIGVYYNISNIGPGSMTVNNCAIVNGGLNLRYWGNNQAKVFANNNTITAPSGNHAGIIIYGDSSNSFLNGNTACGPALYGVYCFGSLGYPRGKDNVLNLLNPVKYCEGTQNIQWTTCPES